MKKSTRDAEMKKLYLAGASRQDTMRRLGITNNNSMSSASSRLGLYWSWPLENRRSGIQPLSAQRSGPKREGDRGGGIVNSIKQRMSRDNDSAAAVLETPPNVPIYEPGSAPKKYGKSPRVSARERHERGYQDEDLVFGGRLSPYPAPSKGLPFETIAFIARHMYEKPFDNKTEV